MKTRSNSNTVFYGSHCLRSLAIGLCITMLSRTTFAQSPANIVSVVTAAKAYLATLSSSQSNSTVYSYNVTNAEAWSNLPIGAATRNGLQFSTLTTAQIAAALNVGTNALGTNGAALFDEIRQADGLIGGSSQSMWGSNLYYIAFVGVPSTNSPWLLQMGGHHIAYNITYNPTNISATPMFAGVEPRIWTNNSVVHAPIETKRLAMYNLRQTLDTSALLTGTYGDVVFGPNASGNHDGNFPQSYPTTGRGQLVSTMTTVQQALVKAAIEAWVTNANPVIVAELLPIYESKVAFAQTYVGYSGGAPLTANASYVRIDGPRVWIEFIVQTGVAYPNDVHYHTLWRDKLADYGSNFGTATTNTVPTISAQPVSVTNAVGTSATFSVTATGTATITYQWYKDSVAISGATNFSYTIASVAATNAGAYYVYVLNPMGSKTSATATLATTTVGNTVPNLAAISDRAITPGTRLSITNSATDSDVPAQSLTFSLIVAPTNATLDASSGVLAWRPLISQADTTNAFSVSVTDSGSPALSATQTFSVIVSPATVPTNSAVAYSSGSYQMQVSGDAGPDYTIQASTDLVSWVSLYTTNPAAMPFIWSDSTADNYPVRFFRVLLGP